MALQDLPTCACVLLIAQREDAGYSAPLDLSVLPASMAPSYGHSLMYNETYPFRCDGQQALSQTIHCAAD